MNRDIDEQNLTAYALGELQSAEERTAVEARLAEAPAARRWVDQVRAAARALADGLAGESPERSDDDGLRLTDLQRAAIERRLIEPRPLARRANGRHWPLWGSIAASLAIVATVTATVVVPLLRGTFRGGAGPQPGIGPGGGADGPADPNPPPAVALPGGRDPRGSSVAGATRPSWADLPMQWPRVPDVPFPDAGVPARDAADANAPRNPGFVRVADRPVSPCPTAPVYPDDAGPDRGSFAAIRRSLERGAVPSPEVVRTEELINALAGPDESPNPSDVPALLVEVAACPWAAGHRLVRITVTAPQEPSGAEAGGATAPTTRSSGLCDVSLRVEFNPASATAYRLIGYDGPDAGSPTPPAVPDVQSSRPGAIALGRSTTVLYEVIPGSQAIGRASPATAPAPARHAAAAGKTSELLTASLRYRDGRTGPPRALQAIARDETRPIEAASPAFRSAAAAAAFGMTLREDPDRGPADYDLVSRLLGQDTAIPDSAPGGAAAEAALLQTSRQAKALSRPPAPGRTARE